MSRIASHDDFRMSSLVYNCTLSVLAEGFVRLKMIVDLVTDTDTYYCIVIDDTFLSTEYLFICMLTHIL